MELINAAVCQFMPPPFWMWLNFAAGGMWFWFAIHCLLRPGLETAERWISICSSALLVLCTLAVMHGIWHAITPACVSALPAAASVVQFPS